MDGISLLISISFILRSTLAIVCLEGRGLPEPSDSTILTRCSTNEVCYIEKYETGNGQTSWHLYNVGCKPLNSCSSSGPILPVVGKRSARKRIDRTTCHKCCSDKDICNLEGHCGSANFTKPFGSTLCYSCPLTSNPNYCNHLTLCDSDSACYIKQTRNLIGQTRWSHGCAQKTQCATFPQSNPQGVCSFCCDTELCNRNCTIKSTIASPRTTNTIKIAPTTPISRITQYNCDFEAGDICLWKQVPSDNFDWLSHRAGTTSTATGPSYDHTIGNVRGTYLYIETSSHNQNEYADLVSPLMTGNQDRCLSLWYHMFGSDIDQLEIGIIQKNQTPANYLVLQVLSGDQGFQWNRMNVTLSSTSDFEVSIRGYKGKGYHGDIAIDDIIVYDGKCQN